jgi:Bifunctional DNA primase/polymerase, N-terminal
VAGRHGDRGQTMNGPQQPPPCGHLRADEAAARRYGFGAAALAYATVFGWEVLALGELSKAPAISKRDGGHGLHDATADVARITSEAGWDGHPWRNIGFRTGQVFTADLDRKRARTGPDGQIIWQDGPGEFMRWITAIGVQLPPVIPYVNTANNGFQLFFRTDGRRLASKTDLGGMWGVDICADDHYVVVPPSRIRLPRSKLMDDHEGVPRRARTPVFGTYTWSGCPCQVPVAPAALLDAIEALPSTGRHGGGGTSGGDDGDDLPLPRPAS